MSKKRLIKTTLTLALVAALGIPGIALAHDEPGGDKGGPGKMHGHRLEMRVHRMQEKLDLSDKQADAVYDILKKAKSGPKCKGEKFSEKKRCRVERRAAVHAEISALLSPEQREKLEKMKEKREERRKKRGKRGHRGHHHD